MSYTVVVAVSAARQIAEVDAWWSAHRPAAPRAVTDDLGAILSFLAETPELGRVFVGATRPGVRRILLRHTGHFLYYVVDDRRRIVHVLALWGAGRGEAPPGI